MADRASVHHDGPVGTSYSYAVGPVMAFAFLGILIVLLRWTFRRGGSLVAAPPKPGTVDEYGVLVPVATPPSYADGEILRRTLEEAGIKATLAHTLDGPRILVWPSDEDRARATLNGR